LVYAWRKGSERLCRPTSANAERGGQFEHTLIIADEGSEVQYRRLQRRVGTPARYAGCVELHVLEGARIRYSSVEN
jgi:Fe-S cluster assembly protein SufB